MELLGQIMLMLFATTTALHIPFHGPRASAHSPAAIVMMSEEPSFWDKIMYGKAGKPAPPAPPTSLPEQPTLKAVFDQLDTNEDGMLSTDELHRAFVIIGVAPSEYDLILEALGCDAAADGCEPGSTVTYDAFESRLPADTRAAIESRLTDDGTLPSLYVPPEAWTDKRSQAELLWEQKVQMQAQRGGNKSRQNEILQNELGKL